MSTRRNKISGLSGFVSFMKRRDAEEALRELDGFDWGGSVLRVGWSKAVPVSARAMYSKGLLSSSSSTQLNTLPHAKPIPQQKTDDIPDLGRGLPKEAETGTGTGTTEAGPVLDTVAGTRAGGVDPVRTLQAVPRRPGGGTAGVVVTEGGRDPTPGRALPEGIEIEIEDTPGTQTKRNSWAMMTLLRSSFELSLWKSKVGVTITRPR